MKMRICGMLLLAVACSSTNSATNSGPDASTTTPPNDAGGGTTNDAGTSDGAGATSTSQLSCFGVVKCVGDCPEATADTCADACLAQVRPSSKTVTDAFAGCLETNKCADADCIQTKCGNELGACIADDTKEQEGTPPTEPSGSLPSTLVGKWSSVGTSTGTSYDFEADGSTVQAFTTDNSLAGCKSGIAVSSSGVSTATADTIIYHRKTGNSVITTCGNAKPSALEPKDLTYRYTLGATADGTPELTLTFVNPDGSLSTSPTVLHR